MSVCNFVYSKDLERAVVDNIRWRIVGVMFLPSIFESRHIDLRRSTHRDLDLRKSTHLSSIFESQRISLRRSKAETSHLQFVVEYRPQLHSYIRNIALVGIKSQHLYL